MTERKLALMALGRTRDDVDGESAMARLPDTLTYRAPRTVKWTSRGRLPDS